MQDKIFKSRLEAHRKWVTPSVINILKGVEKMCLDYKRASEIPLHVRFDGESYTDGTQIVASMMHYFLDPKYSETYWMVVMKAIMAHECQHINSSSIKKAQKMAQGFGEYMQSNYGFNQKIGENIAFQIFNIIEDGRIENIIVDRMPGLKINFIITNGEIRDHGRITEKAKAGDSKAEFCHFVNQILSYAKCGGNLPGIEVYAGTRLEQEFQKIRDDIDAGVRAYSCGECCRIVSNILHQSASYLNDLLKKDSDFANALENAIANMDFSSEPTDEEFNESGKSGNAPLQILRKPSKGKGKGQGQKESADQEQDEESSDDSGSDKKDDTKQSDKSRDGSSRSKNKSNEDESADSDVSTGKGDQQGLESNADADENGDQQGEKTQNQKDGTNNRTKDASSSSKNNKSKYEEQTEDEPDFERKIAAGSDLSGDFSDVELQQKGYTEEQIKKAIEIVRRELEEEQRKLDRTEYQAQMDTGFLAALKSSTGKSYHEVVLPCGSMPLPVYLEAKARQLKQEMIKILKLNNHNRVNTRQGVINPNALWKLRCDEDNFFQIRNKKKKSSIAIYMLIDYSGSMEAANKGVAALKASSIMEEAFSELAACKIALFSSSYSVTHWVVKSFDHKDRNNASYNALSMVRPQGGNCDGYSIRIATEELSKRREKKKVLIVLSDGLPSDYSSAREGMSDVCAAVEEARAKHIEVFSIMYGDEDFQRGQYQSFIDMYKRNVIPSNPDTIIKNLSNLFKKLIGR